MFRDICDSKLKLDADLSDEIKRRAIPRQIGMIIELILRGFVDASLLGCCAVIYDVVKQTGVISEGFLISKSRLAKRDLTIQRLELVSCHVVSNLQNTLNVLSHLHITGFFAWLTLQSAANGSRIHSSLRTGYKR